MTKYEIEHEFMVKRLLPEEYDRAEGYIRRVAARDQWEPGQVLDMILGGRE